MSSSNTFSFEVKIDHAEQIVVQRLRGAMTMHDFDLLEQETTTIVQQLHDKEHVHLLVDSYSMRPATLRVRRRALEVFQDRRVAKLAFIGVNGLERIPMLFFSIAAGRDRVALFDSEQEARQWLRKENS